MIYVTWRCAPPETPVDGITACFTLPSGKVIDLYLWVEDGEFIAVAMDRKTKKVVMPTFLDPADERFLEGAASWCAERLLALESPTGKAGGEGPLADFLRATLERRDRLVPGTDTQH